MLRASAHVARPAVDRHESTARDRSPGGLTSVVIATEGVTVTYGERRALSSVSLQMTPGATGLLGANGAGKSTLIRTMLGVIAPDSGRVHVLGMNVAERPLDVRSRIGYVPEQEAYIPGLSAIASVAYCGELAGLFPGDALQRAHDVLAYVGLGEARYRQTEAFSTGMKQRLKLAQALVHDPDLLLLDEPTDGMDPRGREEMLALIGDLVHRHHVHVLFSSHLLPDIERTCDHVVILRQGVVAGAGSVDQLRRPRHHIYDVRIKGDQTAFLAVLQAAGFACDVTDDGAMAVHLAGGGTQDLFALAAKSAAQIRHLKQRRPTLEDVFVELTATSPGDKADEPA